MSVKIVTPSDAAASPSHPEHARWVKERTLKIEAEHALRSGLTFRDAESNNSKNLTRLDARKRLPKPKRKKRKQQQSTAPRNEEHARLAAAGVIKRPAPPQIAKPNVSPCNWCGLCLPCKREARLRMIMTSARLEGIGSAPYRLTMELVAITFAASAKRDYKDALGRELPFSRLTGVDRVRARIAGAEWVCDRSTSFMGEWR